MKKKVYIISNSQGTSVGVSEGENYPSLLSKYDKNEYEFHWMLMSSWNIENFFNYIENIISIKPDFLIVQIGIIDCAPRILSKKAKYFFKGIPFGNHFSKTLHLLRTEIIQIRRFFKFETFDVPLPRFSELLTNFNSIIISNIKV